MFSGTSAKISYRFFLRSEDSARSNTFVSRDTGQINSDG